jgi:hypothetical protein
MSIQNRKSVVVEVLESRRLLAAGAVSARVVDGRLVVTGDNAQNVVRLDGLDLAPGQVRVSGLDVSPVNGWYKSVVFERVTRGVRVELGRGDDILAVASLDLPGGLTVYGGAGDDGIRLDTTWVGGATSVGAAAGDDRIDLASVSARGGVTLDAGEGADQVTVGSSRFRNAVSARTSGAAGGDVVSVADSGFVGRFGVRTGGGADRVSLGGSAFGGEVEVRAGDGDDAVELPGSAFTEGTDVDGEAGRDTVTRDGVSKTFDFRSGVQGWEAGFADHGGTQYDEHGTPLTPEEFYGLQSGSSPLPPDLGTSANGFMLSGFNKSDDLFMFLKRPLGPADGVRPGQDYRIEFEITFASSAGTGVDGVGGSPGESVYLKAGGVEVEPMPVVVDARGAVRMNVDKGEQSRGGPAASVASRISNGIHAGRTRFFFPYLALTRGHVHETTVTADANGSLWLLIGTDSGFEARTTLYYRAVTVRLIPV